MMPAAFRAVVDTNHTVRVTPTPTVPHMTRSKSQTYNERWREMIRPGVVRSAEGLVPVLHEMLMEPESVVDVGCGEGWFAAEWAKAGADRVVGIDGDYVSTMAPGEGEAWTFVAHDLTQPLTVPDEHFDVAMSLEVAEHLPESRAASFVAELCTLAPIVVFAAAVPGQGGDGHVNEQWPSYWLPLFESHGFYGTGALRFTIWESDISWWYRQNLLIFADDPNRLPARIDGCPDIVHPGMWDHHRPMRRR